MKWVRVGVSLALLLTALAGTVATVSHSPTAAPNSPTATSSSPTAVPHSPSADHADSIRSANAGLYPHGRFDDSAATAHGEVVVIGIENAATNRSIAPMVREAAEYWATHSRRYTGYRFEYRIEPDVSNPTYRVRVVESVDNCGRNGTYLACTGVAAPDEPVANHSIRVVDGMSRESLAYALVHEFGHTLGLRHGDRPADVMNATYNVTWKGESSR